MPKVILRGSCGYITGARKWGSLAAPSAASADLPKTEPTVETEAFLKGWGEWSHVSLFRPQGDVLFVTAGCWDLVLEEQCWGTLSSRMRSGDLF